MERKWRTGKPGMLPLIGSQRTDTTEWLNPTTRIERILKAQNGLNNKGKHIFRNQNFKMCVLCMYIWTYSFIKNKGQKSRRKNHIWQVGRLPVTPFMCKQIKWLVKRCKWILMQNIGTKHSTHKKNMYD